MSPSSASRPGAPMASAQKRVLMVEDELLIRFSLSEELRDAGLEVIEAINADEAVTILDSSVRIDLMISDVRMPGPMDGIELLCLVKARYPAMPVIIFSGHYDPAQALANGANRFLHKPFVFGAMVQAVTDELEQAS